MRKKKESRTMCPFMGAESKPAMGGVVAVTATFEQGSNGTSKREPAKPPKTAQERIEALRHAGVDVGNLFAMQGANGGEFVASNKDGRLTILDENDPIFNRIIGQGTIPNRRLFRRWVMAQMFHMLTHIPYGERVPIGVTGMIRRLGYEYQWKMLMSELYAQMKMEGRDPVNFADRNRWFNVGVVAAMAKGYMDALKNHIDALPKKRCKGLPYKRINGKDVFVSDMQTKLFSPLNLAMMRISQARNAAQLYYAAKKFNEARIKMAWDTPQSKEWVDAYKGSGAFFTIQNMIRFHNCVLIDDAGRCLDKHQSQTFLSAKAELYKNGDGWRLLAVLKKMLEDNRIDIDEKMAEWRRKK